MAHYTHEELVEIQRLSGIPHLPTQLTASLRLAVGGEGERSNDWEDKPHRLVYEACREVERNVEEIDQLRHALERAKAFIINNHALTGVCCCGDNEDGHGFLSGHEFVDSGFWAAHHGVAEIDKVLGIRPDDQHDGVETL